MDIRFSCPICEHHMVIDEAGAGMMVQCPECGADALVPTIAKPELVNQPPAVPQTQRERTVAIKWTPPPLPPPPKKP